MASRCRNHRDTTTEPGRLVRQSNKAGHKPVAAKSVRTTLDGCRIIRSTAVARAIACSLPTTALGNSMLWRSSDHACRHSVKAKLIGLFTGVAALVVGFSAIWLFVATTLLYICVEDKKGRGKGELPHGQVTMDAMLNYPLVVVWILSSSCQRPYVCCKR